MKSPSRDGFVIKKKFPEKTCGGAKRKAKEQNL